MNKCCGERKDEVIQIKKLKKGGMAYFISKIGEIEMVVEGEIYIFDSKTPTKAPKSLRKALFLERVPEPAKKIEKKPTEKPVEIKVAPQEHKEIGGTNESI